MKFWPWRRRVSSPEAGSAPEAAALTCAECLEVLYEFLDGELDSADRARVQAHFDLCVECFKNLQFEQRFLEQLRAAATHGVASEGLRSRIMEVLEREAD
ncbi:MAG: zf-HC2 domain-containing protein [Gemmatimonadota bacterium]